MCTARHVKKHSENSIDTAKQKPKRWRKPQRRVLPMPTKLHKVKDTYDRGENKRAIEESLHGSTDSEMDQGGTGTE